jgi:hypothetical protein
MKMRSAGDKFITHLLAGKITLMYDLIERHVWVNTCTRVIIYRFLDGDLTLVYDLVEYQKSVTKGTRIPALVCAKEPMMDLTACMDVYYGNHRYLPLKTHVSYMGKLHKLHRHQKIALGKLVFAPETALQIHVLLGT